LSSVRIQSLRKKIINKVGTHGAKKLIVALQKEIDKKEGEK